MTKPRTQVWGFGFSGTSLAREPVAAATDFAFVEYRDWR
jgi:hypothetical protein